MFSRPLFPKTSSFTHLATGLSGVLLRRVNKSKLTPLPLSLCLLCSSLRACVGYRVRAEAHSSPMSPRARAHTPGAPTHIRRPRTQSRHWLLWTGPSEPSGPPAEPSAAASSAVGAWGCQQRRSYSHRSGLAASDGTPGGRVSPETGPLLQTETAVSAPFCVVQTPPLKLQLFLHLWNSSSCVFKGVSCLFKSLRKPKSVIFSAVYAVHAAYNTLMWI